MTPYASSVFPKVHIATLLIRVSSYLLTLAVFVQQLNTHYFHQRIACIMFSTLNVYTLFISEFKTNIVSHMFGTQISICYPIVCVLDIRCYSINHIPNNATHFRYSMSYIHYIYAPLYTIAYTCPDHIVHRISYPMCARACCTLFYTCVLGSITVPLVVS